MTAALRNDVITLFPEMVSVFSEHGVCGRAIATGRVDLQCWNPRQFTTDKHRTVDDRPFGGGPGMVMKVAPLQACLAHVHAQSKQAATTVYMSPQGEPLTQALVAQLATQQHILLISGRYEGIDERLLATEVDHEISIGDFILSGGEIAAAAVIDAMIRLLPGTLGHAESAAQDTFSDGLLDHPQFTRPADLNDLEVPSVLVSGDHEAIRRWRLRESLGRTWLRRPDLLRHAQLDIERRRLLNEFIREYCSRSAEEHEREQHHSTTRSRANGAHTTRI